MLSFHSRPNDSFTETLTICLLIRLLIHMRRIWKVRTCQVFSLSNLITNPFMLGAILRSYLKVSFLYVRTNLHEDVVERNIFYCEYMYCLYIGKNKISID